MQLVKKERNGQIDSTNGSHFGVKDRSMSSWYICQFVSYHCFFIHLSRPTCLITPEILYSIGKVNLIIIQARVFGVLTVWSYH